MSAVPRRSRCSHLFGAIYRRLFGTVGRLAAQNALRNPRRTAATASALMIGLALMAMMSIFGSSASASTDAAIGKTLTSQFIVSNVVGQPFSPDVADQIRRLDGVAGVTQLRSAFPELDGGGSASSVGDRPEGVRARLRRPDGGGLARRPGAGHGGGLRGAGEEQGPRGRRHRHDGVPGRGIRLRVVALFREQPGGARRLRRHPRHPGEGRPRAAGLDGVRDQGARGQHRRGPRARSRRSSRTCRP